MDDDLQKFISSILRAIQESDYKRIAEMVWQRSPYIYDNSGYWWIYNQTHYRLVDEIDLLRLLDAVPYNTYISSGVKQKLLTSMKMTGRNHLEELTTPPDYLVNTLSGVANLQTKKVDKERNPTYFFKWCIPHKIGTSTEIPTIEGLLNKWLPNESEKLLDIMAYCLIPKYHIHRIFFLLGSGGNGRSTFNGLITRLLGMENICSVSLSQLVKDRFATADFYGKLANVGVETEPNDVLNHTAILKRLSGGKDIIRAQRKFGQPFTFVNYAKLIFIVNELPTTLDRSDGFYRRVEVIHFKNRFQDGQEVIDTISEEEIENLLRLLLTRAVEIYNKGILPSFNTTVADRKEKYESLSNPLGKFIEDFCETDSSSLIPTMEFLELYNSYAVEHGLLTYDTKSIWSQLRANGVTGRVKRRIKGKPVWCIKGLRWGGVHN